jgi:Uma2 family endonuclease
VTGQGDEARTGRVRFQGMRTLLPDPPPAEFEQLLQRRREWGADTHDEVWKGVLHMAPAPRDARADISQQLAELLGPLARAAGCVPTIAEFNLGGPEDYRVPDGGLHRTRIWGTYAPTAALVVEILSPGDETWEKLSFYAAHGVGRAVHWLALDPHGAYQAVEHSRLIDLGAAQLTERLDWP